MTTMTTSFTTGFAVAAERQAVPEKFKWNLADLYPSEAAWTKAKDELAHRLPELARYRGHLGKSPRELAAALQTMFDLDQNLSRLSVYASALSDEDVRAARPREMKQGAEELATAFSSACSWVRPEILGLDAAKVRKFVAEEPKLANYRVYLEDTLRRKAHTLSAAEERVA
ncbi:MAG: oligoendopeptidase F, partial [Polyangia bacterium]